MTATPERVRAALEWLEKADHDLITAVHTLKLRENCPLDMVSFHGQQCVEKCLKGLLVFCGLEFPPTHDIRLLLQRLPESVGTDVDPARMIGLNRYAVEARYPRDWKPITREDAEAAVEVAREVREAAGRTISGP